MRLLTAVSLLLIVPLLPSVGRGDDKGDKKVDHVFEIRTYYAADGKMDALNARFRDHTMKLFDKHHMKSIGYWQTIQPKDGKQVLIYILEHDSEAAAKKNWDAFQKDPAWIKAKKESEKDGTLVEKVERVFTRATDYSPIK